MNSPTPEDVVVKLREACVDWNGQPMHHLEEPRRSFDCGETLEIADLISRLTTENEMLREALKPFAAMGRVMDKRAKVTFGKRIPDTEIVCESSGEAGLGIITMGHFRDAASLLPDAPGWGGQYLDPGIRTALSISSQGEDHL